MKKTSTHPYAFPRELPVGARQRSAGRGIPFGVALLKTQVGEDGKSPIQLADLFESHEAACAVN